MLILLHPFDNILLEGVNVRENNIFIMENYLSGDSKFNFILSPKKSFFTPIVRIQFDLNLIVDFPLLNEESIKGLSRNK